MKSKFILGLKTDGSRFETIGAICIVGSSSLFLLLLFLLIIGVLK